MYNMYYVFLHLCKKLYCCVAACVLAGLAGQDLWLGNASVKVSISWLGITDARPAQVRRDGKIHQGGEKKVYIFFLWKG